MYLPGACAVSHKASSETQTGIQPTLSSRPGTLTAGAQASPAFRASVGASGSAPLSALMKTRNLEHFSSYGNVSQAPQGTISSHLPPDIIMYFELSSKLLLPPSSKVSLERLSVRPFYVTGQL